MKHNLEDHETHGSSSIMVYRRELSRDRFVYMFDETVAMKESKDNHNATIEEALVGFYVLEGGEVIVSVEELEHDASWHVVPDNDLDMSPQAEVVHAKSS